MRAHIARAQRVARRTIASMPAALPAAAKRDVVAAALAPRPRSARAALKRRSSAAPDRAVKTADIAPFFATLRDANPEPASELEYASVFELLAAVLLSAQATDRGVNKATRHLFAIAPTPQKMLALGLPALEDAIKTIGLYRNKAKNLLATCRILVERARRPGAADARGARGAARRRPQDRQRRAQRRLRRCHDRRRHARLSRRQPDRAGHRSHADRGRAAPARARSRGSSCRTRITG